MPALPPEPDTDPQTKPASVTTRLKTQSAEFRLSYRTLNGTEFAFRVVFYPAICSLPRRVEIWQNGSRFGIMVPTHHSDWEINVAAARYLISGILRRGVADFRWIEQPDHELAT